MHAPIWCGGGAFLRTGLPAPSALPGAVPALPVRQYLRVGDCQGAGRRGRLAGALLHTVFPLCLGRGADYRAAARSSATPDAPVVGLGKPLRSEFRACVPALALPARRECADGWRLGRPALPARRLGDPVVAQETIHYQLFTIHYRCHPVALSPGGPCLSANTD